jgi:integrase/recombinase XerD
MEIPFDTRPEVEVIVYRHRSTCKFTAEDKLGQCKCRKHLYVRSTRQRISAKTRSWETARQRAQEWADAHDPALIKRREEEAREAAIHKTVEDAFDEFIAVKESASANPEGFSATRSKYTTIKKQLVDFLAQRNSGRKEAERILYTHQITPELLNQWMATWKTKTYWSKAKRRDNVVAFFDFALDQNWIKATVAKDRGNPARKMAKIAGRKSSSIPTLPFTPKQFAAVLAATLHYADSLETVNKAEIRNKGQRLHALVNLMRWSGLAITDAVTLDRSRLDGNDRLELYRTKTENAVTVLLPPHVARELRNVPPGPEAHPEYFFWSGKGQRNKAASTWQKALRRLWKLVTPPLDLRDRRGKRIRPKSHMFRNTFAVELLKKGVSLNHIAMLLADTPEIVKEHYYPWVPELQQLLEDEVRKTWEPIILADADRAAATAQAVN